MNMIKYSSKSQSISPTPIFLDLCQTNNLDMGGFNQQIVLLTKNNSNIVENLIQNDDTYIPFAKIIFDSFNQNGFMRAIRTNNNKDNPLFIVAREIDRDNNTNAWRYQKNRKSFMKMINYIKNPKNKFFDRLDSGDTDLPDDIVKNCGTALKSLSSKICQHLCEYIYQKDNYYKNDSKVRNMLLFYLDCYGIRHNKIKSIGDVNKLTYRDYHNLLDELMDARNNIYNDGTISRSELDHIIWYCYKSF